MILCCGEALIDMIPVDPAANENNFTAICGGAIFNTSIALGRLEEPVALLSGVSTDLLGEQLAKELTISNVSTELLIRSDRPTTLAFVKLTNGQAEYSFYDENTAGRLLSFGELPEIPDNVSTVYFGGISLCAEPAATTYESLFLQEAPNRITMLDPNIRPSFISDETAYRERLGRMISAADIVKVSDEDLEWLVQSGSDLRAKVMILHEMGAKLVVLTEGSAGATAILKGQEPVHVPVPNVDVIDTVGAGDTFNAGFLAKLSQLGCLKKDIIGSLSYDHLKGSLAFAASVAAVTVSRKGANPPTRVEVEAAYKSV